MLCAVVTRLSKENMGNTAFLSIIAPVGGPSAATGSFSYSLIQLHEQASVTNALFVFVGYVGSVPALSACQTC